MYIISEVAITRGQKKLVSGRPSIRKLKQKKREIARAACSLEHQIKKASYTQLHIHKLSPWIERIMKVVLISVFGCFVYVSIATTTRTLSRLGHDNLQINR